MNGQSAISEDDRINSNAHTMADISSIMAQRIKTGDLLKSLSKKGDELIFHYEERLGPGKVDYDVISTAHKLQEVHDIIERRRAAKDQFHKSSDRFRVTNGLVNVLCFVKGNKNVNYVLIVENDPQRAVAGLEGKDWELDAVVPNIPYFGEDLARMIARSPSAIEEAKNGHMGVFHRSTQGFRFRYEVGRDVPKVSVPSYVLHKTYDLGFGLKLWMWRATD